MTDTPQDDQTIVPSDKKGNPPCPTRKGEPHNALPIGTHMGEFEIVGLVGEGGFGIVYLAQDHSLERKVALKEYMPATLAARGEDASVVVRSERHQETFEIGRRSFVNEARLLAQFDHPALVKVYRFWEANGTAYMAMPYYDGITLGDLLRNDTTPLSEDWLKKLLDPVTDALGLIHQNNCFHRDIAPDNIMLLRDGRALLLDFGAARRVIGDMTQALTVILKPGYAPVEQYAEIPGMRQGAWTDIYALAAVIYYYITRRLPPPSVSRVMHDTYEPLADVAKDRYSSVFLRGLDLCLAVKPERRPQTMAEMRQLIGLGQHGAPPSAPSPQMEAPIAPFAASRQDEAPPNLPPVRNDAAPILPGPSRTGKRSLTGIFLGFVLLAAGGGAGWYLLGLRGISSPAPVTQSAPELMQSVAESPAPSVSSVPAESHATVSAPVPATTNSAVVTEQTTEQSAPVTSSDSTPATLPAPSAQDASSSITSRKGRESQSSVASRARTSRQSNSPVDEDKLENLRQIKRELDSYAR